MEKTIIWTTYGDEELEKLNIFSENYKLFLNESKTERECIETSIRMAEQEGYQDIKKMIDSGKRLIKGDKIYASLMGKALALFCIGEEPISSGMNILGAHVDSPRIDVKQVPLYENSDLVYLDTHYYGAIKKYQWVTRQMAVHGVVVKRDGSVIKIVIGEKEEDPVFIITDILPHLGAKQLEEKARLVIEGEKLDILVGNGSRCHEDDLTAHDKSKAKQSILHILKEVYDIDEDDFLSAELELVPAEKARDCGIDRSMIVGYGQDDRVCVYACLQAMLSVEAPKTTTCCLLVDKEEVGSFGATGMQSCFFENMIAEIVALTEGESELKVRRALYNSRMLSADVSAAYDPLYSDVFEKNNAAYLGRGISLNKFTGSRGKSGANDANAEYIGKLRKIFDKNNVSYQITEIGKVDVGGGGTISHIMAKYGMEVIDCGVAILNMHAPNEVCSKADLYEAYRGYKVFLSNIDS